VRAGGQTTPGSVRFLVAARDLIPSTPQTTNEIRALRLNCRALTPRRGRSVSGGGRRSDAKLGVAEIRHPSERATGGLPANSIRRSFAACSSTGSLTGFGRRAPRLTGCNDVNLRDLAFQSLRQTTTDARGRRGRPGEVPLAGGQAGEPAGQIYPHVLRWTGDPVRPLLQTRNRSRGAPAARPATRYGDGSEGALRACLASTTTTADDGEW